MPRIPPSLFRRAAAVSPHAATLLPACRDVSSAAAELRWIREHVRKSAPPSSAPEEARVARLCARRGRGEPLQYVLGSQPFGALDIRCRRGVLAPRAETEAYALHLAGLLLRSGLLGEAAPARTTTTTTTRIVDFCTGTGCIALALYERLAKGPGGAVHVLGVDVSQTAVGLARENLKRNAEVLVPQSAEKSVGFLLADVFDDEAMAAVPGCDVLVSNPPYISRDVWTYGGGGEMGYSVRKHEPVLALVPGEELPAYECCDRADVFYARLLDVAARLGPRVLLFEVGDREQALRVAGLVARHEYTRSARLEVWRDWPDLTPEEDEAREVEVDGVVIPVKGSGNVRSLFVCL